MSVTHSAIVMNTLQTYSTDKSDRAGQGYLVAHTHKHQTSTVIANLSSSQASITKMVFIKTKMDKKS